MTTFKRVAPTVLLAIFGPAMRHVDNQITAESNDLDNTED